MKFRKKDLISIIESYLFYEKDEKKDNKNSEDEHDEDKDIAATVKYYEEHPDEDQEISLKTANQISSITNQKIKHGEKLSFEEFKNKYGRLISKMV